MSASNVPLTAFTATEQKDLVQALESDARIDNIAAGIANMITGVIFLCFALYWLSCLGLGADAYVQNTILKDLAMRFGSYEAANTIQIAINYCCSPGTIWISAVKILTGFCKFIPFD